MFLSVILGVLLVVLVLEANEESSISQQTHTATIFTDNAVEGGSRAAQNVSICKEAEQCNLIPPKYMNSSELPFMTLRLVFFLIYFLPIAETEDLSS